jgi:hypothetical protein
MAALVPGRKTDIPNFYAVSQANAITDWGPITVPYQSLILTSKIPTMSVEITTA